MRLTWPANSASSDGSTYFLSPQMSRLRHFGGPAAGEEILHPVPVGGGLVDGLDGLERQRNPGRGHLPVLLVVLAVPDEFGPGGHETLVPRLTS